MGWGKTGIDAGSRGTESRAPDLSSSLPRSARLRSRSHISPQLQNSCLHFSEPGSAGPRPRSVGAGLRLDSLGLLPAGTFQSRQPFSPRTAARPERMEKLGTESPAGISPTSHSCGRLGSSGLRSQQLQRQSRRPDPPARPPRSPGAMPPSASPRPSYGTTQIPITRQVGSSRRRPAKLGHPPGEAWRSLGTGARTVRASGSREERAGESRSRAALHAEVSPFESSGVVSGF